MRKERDMDSEETKPVKNHKMVFECRVYDGAGLLKEVISAEKVVERVWEDKKPGNHRAVSARKAKQELEKLEKEIRDAKIR